MQAKTFLDIHKFKKFMAMPVKGTLEEFPDVDGTPGIIPQ
jgi:hypothetical protein